MLNVFLTYWIGKLKASIQAMFISAFVSYGVVNAYELAIVKTCCLNYFFWLSDEVGIFKVENKVM